MSTTPPTEAGSASGAIPLDPPSFLTALERNREFAAAGGHVGAVIRPKLRAVVVTCLDPRTDPAHFLGLAMSDAIVVRNVGGRVTPEVINDIAFIGQMAEAASTDGPLFEVALIHHTQCGAGALANDAFLHRFAERTGGDEDSLRQRAIIDPAETVVKDVRLLRASESISPRIAISGYVYDVVAGTVAQVTSA